MRYSTGEADRRINELFNLPARGDEQDWEVELAAPERLEEFMDAYEGKTSILLNSDERFALLELIIASFDVNYTSETTRLWPRLQTYLLAEWKDIWETVVYWARLEGTERDEGFSSSSFHRNLILSLLESAEEL